MQLEAHRIQDTQNGSEIWMLRIAFKGTIDRRSFKPGYFGDVGDIVPPNGGADGMTYFVDVRGLKSAINAICDFAAARLRRSTPGGVPWASLRRRFACSSGR
jgi:hypothetical protein